VNLELYPLSSPSDKTFSFLEIIDREIASSILVSSVSKREVAPVI